MHLREKYIVETENFKRPNDTKDVWARTRVNIFEVQEDNTKKYLGNFVRNYPSLYSTWEPFEQDGKVYALCAPDYTTTSVISLPECEIVAKEGDWNCFGFCPTGFYVPEPMDENVDFENENLVGKFGFVCGCVWGDDNLWKIQFLDLSEINQEKVIRDDRFGYIMLDGSSSELPDAFDYMHIDEDGEIEFDLKCIKGFDTALKQKIGKKQIEPNKLADKNANYIIETIQQRLKCMANDANFWNYKSFMETGLGETEKKLIRQIFYNTVVEIIEDE